MYNVLDCGGVPDGKTNNALALQQAINACAESGGGRVCLGPGNWLSGAFELKSGVELHLESGCKLIGSPDLADYPLREAEGYHAHLNSAKGSHSLIWAHHAEKIALTGNGVIDGSGLHFYEGDGPEKRAKPLTPRPRILMLYRCQEIAISGLTFRNSPCWTLWLMQSENIRVDGIKIEADCRMCEVDGIDVDSCRRVLIQNCIMDTEDDCIAIRAIQHMYDQPAICEDVSVAHCLLRSHSQGIRIGCPNDGVIRRLQFSDLMIESQCHGISSEHPQRYFKTERPSRACIEDIRISQSHIRAEQRPLRWEVGEEIDSVRMSGMNFSHLRLQGGNACLFSGNAQNMLRDLHFDNVQIAVLSEEKITFRHTEGVRTDHMSW